MQGETLHKLAEVVRTAAAYQKSQQRVKCAQVVQALVALELLRRKVG